MKLLIIFVSHCIFVLAMLSNASTVIAADCQSTPTEPCQSVIPIPPISKKLRREAGIVIDDEGDDDAEGAETSSGNRGRFAFKANRGRFAFKANRGRFAFKANRGRFAFKANRGRFAFKANRGRFAFKANRGRFAFKANRGSEVALKTETQKQKQETIRLPLTIAPLVPQSPGLTVTDQPTLYWYMSYWWKGDIELTLNEFGASEPVIEHLIKRSDCDENINDDLICHLRLVDYDVHLKPDKDYEWFIFIVMDPEQRTSDWLASGFIRYTKPSKQLTESLKLSSLEQQYQVYKQKVLWYDAIDYLSVQIVKSHNNQALRKELATWIKQVEMPLVADYLEIGCKEDCYYEIDVE